MVGLESNIKVLGRTLDAYFPSNASLHIMRLEGPIN
jgi:hypothetical protein